MLGPYVTKLKKIRSVNSSPMDGQPMSADGRLTGKEDYDTGYGQASIERRGQDVVVLNPPGVVSTEGVPVEEEVDDEPAGIIDAGSRRDVVTADEDKGPVDHPNTASISPFTATSHSPGLGQTRTPQI